MNFFTKLSISSSRLKWFVDRKKIIAVFSPSGKKLKTKMHPNENRILAIYRIMFELKLKFSELLGFASSDAISKYILINF